GGDRPAAPPEPPVVGAFADPWPHPGRQPPLGSPGSRLHRAALPTRRDRQGPVRGLPRRLSRRSPGGPHRRPPPPRPDPYPRAPPIGSARCSVGREPPDPHLPAGPGGVAPPLPDLRCPPL